MLTRKVLLSFIAMTISLNVLAAPVWKKISTLDAGATPIKEGTYGTCSDVSATTSFSSNCTWGDGQVMRYAGITDDGRYLFADNADLSVNYEWGAYNGASYHDVAGITNFTSATTGTATNQAATVVKNDNSAETSGRAWSLAYLNSVTNTAVSNTSSNGIGALEACALKGMYLPSLHELSLIWLNVGSVGSMAASTYYWSSSEYNTAGAWRLNSATGTNGNSKNGACLVRCARSFSP